MAGCVNLLGEKGRHSSWVSWEEVSASDPDVVLAFPCGLSLARVRREFVALSGDLTLRGLRAFAEGGIYLCEGHQYFNRPGPRLAETLEIVAEILDPETFRFGWEGIGWERMPKEVIEARSGPPRSSSSRRCSPRRS